MNNDQYGIRATPHAGGGDVSIVGGSGRGSGIKTVPWYRWRLWRLAWERKDARIAHDCLLLGHGEEWRRLWVRVH